MPLARVEVVVGGLKMVAERLAADGDPVLGSGGARLPVDGGQRTRADGPACVRSKWTVPRP